MRLRIIIAGIGIIALASILLIGKAWEVKQRKLAALTQAINLERYSYNYSSFSGDKTNIILFGDSRIEHWQTSWPSSIAVVNTGISGSTSVQALKRLDAHVINAKPDWVILQVGVNDIVASRMQFGESRKKTLANITDNIVQISERLLENNIKLVVMNIPPSIKPGIARIIFWQGDLETSSEAVNKLLSERLPDNVIFYDTVSTFTSPLQQWRTEYRAEPLHWNKQAYQKLTRDMLDIIN